MTPDKQRVSILESFGELETKQICVPLNLLVGFSLLSHFLTRLSIFLKHLGSVILGNITQTYGNTTYVRDYFSNTVN